MTALELLRKLDSEATKGPWGSTSFEVYCDDFEGGCHEEHSTCRLSGDTQTIADVYGLEEFADKDSRLIVALRNMLPEFIAMVKACNAARAKTRCSAGLDEEQARELTREASQTLHEALARLNEKALTLSPCECPNPKGLECRRCYDLARAKEALEDD